MLERNVRVSGDPKVCRFSTRYNSPRRKGNLVRIEKDVERPYRDLLNVCRRQTQGPPDTRLRSVAQGRVVEFSIHRCEVLGVRITRTDRSVCLCRGQSPTVANGLLRRGDASVSCDLSRRPATPLDAIVGPHGRCFNHVAREVSSTISGRLERGPAVLRAVRTRLPSGDPSARRGCVTRTGTRRPRLERHTADEVVAEGVAQPATVEPRAYDPAGALTSRAATVPCVTRDGNLGLTRPRGSAEFPGRGEARLETEGVARVTNADFRNSELATST
jgi:hypothetical protein